MAAFLDHSSHRSHNGQNNNAIIMKTYILDGIWGSHRRWERLRSLLGPNAVIWKYDNSGRSSLAGVGEQLAGELAKSGEPFHLVGFSMGGLVVREALRVGGGLPVGRIALLHSPHAGSQVARFLPLPACRDLRPGSAFLQNLAGSPWPYESLCTWCPYDLMVLPGRSGDFPDATVSLCCRIPAHIWPVFSSALHSVIREFLLHGRVGV
jgi:pimeloyl-ACP methyl ester carboxylesterase